MFSLAENICESICLTILSLWMIKYKSCQVFWGSVARGAPEGYSEAESEPRPLELPLLGESRKVKGASLGPGPWGPEPAGLGD